MKELFQINVRKADGTHEAINVLAIASADMPAISLAAKAALSKVEHAVTIHNITLLGAVQLDATA